VISRLRALWNNLFHRKQLDRDLDEELRAYVELVSAEKVRSGAEPEAAYREARREAGGIDQVTQGVREIRIGASLDRLAQDIRYGIRTLAKNPAFSLVAVTTLALGIGANTAMFSLLDQVVLGLLPVSRPEQLVIVAERGNHYGGSFGVNDVSYPMYEDLRDNNHVFSGMFCRFPASISLGYGNHPERVNAELISGSYFPVLGVSAALGRTITPDDDRIPDGHPVVMLSYSFWQTHFGSDRAIIGKTIALNGHNMTIIGIARPGFDGVELGNPAKVFVPIMMKAEMTPYWDGIKDRRRRLSWVMAYGRLRSGVSMQQGQASLQPLLHSILTMEVQEPDSVSIPLMIASSFSEIGLRFCLALKAGPGCVSRCKGRSGFLLRSQEPYFCLPVRTSRICCWRAPQRESGRWLSVWRSARAGRESCVSFWSRACSSQARAPRWD
jgi:hypothetical protein